MSSYLNSLPPSPLTEKPASQRPWETRIKHVHGNKMKYAHNSETSNLEYLKEKVQQEKEHKKIKDKFTVIGSNLSREFLYCKHLVQGLHWFKPRVFDKPHIRGVTAVDWPQIWNNLKLAHGNKAYCNNVPVVVLINGIYLGGPQELKTLLEEVYKYVFNLNINYFKESVREFTKLYSSTNRPHIYMHFSINGAAIGTMIFMLYSDVVPRTCENFIRLCTETKGGYAGTPVHRIVKDCWIQCGGFGLKSTDLNCENFIVNFDRRGVLGMANAERHVDCSTQFFVISQAAEWMNTHYVAFGQLIEGENTLKQIEGSPTWYESPTQDITIYAAGILNMECHHEAINKTGREYIAYHIEHTFAFSIELYEEILDMVFNEIVEKSNLRREEETADIFTSEIRSSQKCIHGSYSELVSSSNNEFDEEFQSDELVQDKTFTVNGRTSNFDNTISYFAPSNTTDVSKPQYPNRPFYFPLVDVLYPGEIDSTTDLKRFLKGLYCLESDVDHKNTSKSWMELPEIPSDNSELQHMMVLSAESSKELMDSEVELGLDEYYRKNGEKFCFARKIMRDVAKSLNYNKFTDAIESNAVIGDETLRKMKHAAANLKSALQRKKRISIDETVPRSMVQRRIKRSQTGYIRDTELKDFLSHNSTESDEDVNDEDDDEHVYEMKKTQQKKPCPVEIKYNTEDHATRKSALLRLFNDIDKYDVKGAGPTLMNYQSVFEDDDEEVIPMFMKPSTKIECLDSYSNLEPGLQIPEKSRLSVGLFPSLHNNETDVQTVTYPSITASAYAKTRPSLSVKEYQEKNRKSCGKK